MDKTRRHLETFIKSIPSAPLRYAPFAPADISYVYCSGAEAFVFKPRTDQPDLFIGVPVDIHHSARVFRGVPYTHKDYASLQVPSPFVFLRC